MDGGTEPYCKKKCICELDLAVKNICELSCSVKIYLWTRLCGKNMFPN